ncbi:unnamed protein product [Moneuplotes crassus]|uniref:Uncharacterized protein n=1 Tax=Euplotes crassus TaxID=5936 RepID=A0AAD1UMC3_EUPCR|nr:unnamed protein product [Moneuplotes crassus]
MIYFLLSMKEPDMLCGENNSNEEFISLQSVNLLNLTRVYQRISEQEIISKKVIG